MKSSSIWVALLGGALVAIFGIGAAVTVSSPIELLKVTVVQVIVDLLWVGFGAFLITLYVRGKHSEEARAETPVIERDSVEDIERLKKRRRWTFAFVLLISALGSVDSWLLNDYLAGFTPVNIFVTFDLILNLVLLYFVYELFKGTKEVLRPLLYVVIFYTVVEMFLEVWSGNWFTALSYAGLIIYFAYATIAPVTRRNHRIAHLIILPAAIVLLFGLGSLDTTHINKLAEEETLLEQEYSATLASINTEYGQYLQREVPTADDINDVQVAITKWEEKRAELVATLALMEEDYLRQRPTIDREKLLDRHDKFLVVIDLVRQQTVILNEMMEYAEEVNFQNPTEKQIADLDAFETALTDKSDEITVAQFDLDTESE